jgi:UDP-GlcNAc:undecaprenyl-phosphate GlcNAc-1-phosphate transferase
MMMPHLLYALIATFLSTLFFIAVIRKVALSLNLTAKKNFRRTQQKTIPLLGGLAVFLAFNVGLQFLGPGHSILFHLSYLLPVMIFGILDDLIELSAKIKLPVQLIAVGIWMIQTPVQNNLFVQVGAPPWLALGFTAFYMVGLMNMTNMIDGLDGLAPVFGMLVALATAFLPGIIDQQALLVFAAAFLGFLIFNFHPAKIYLGDSGSQLIGLFLGAQVLTWKPEQIDLFSALVPLFVFAHAEIDASLAIGRRLKAGLSPFQGDREHLHHKLQRMDLNVRQTWALIAVIVACSCLTGWLLAGTLPLAVKLVIGVLSTVLLCTILLGLIKMDHLLSLKASHYSKGFLHQYIQFEETPPSVSHPDVKIVVYDLFVYYQELQWRGVEHIRDFISEYAELINRLHPNSGKVVYGSYSVIVVQTDSRSFEAFQNEVNKTFFALTQKFEIQKNDGVRPWGIQHYDIKSLKFFFEKHPQFEIPSQSPTQLRVA